MIQPPSDKVLRLLQWALFFFIVSGVCQVIRAGVALYYGLCK